ncbi:dihydroorotase [Planctomicrobium sp. SH664]|uniref:dihydroorotase n=1 Tax=Planctomicrobium sp. SH664 TaxID=3448125 RepID=UPI003F5AFD0A
MSTLLLTGGRIIDPARGVDRVGDLLVLDGKFTENAWTPLPIQRTIDARGLIVCPGLIDCHVAFREPGFEEDETIETGAAAALAGGFTTVACLPETVPVVDSRASAEFIVRQGERAGKCRVLPIGAVTKGRDGKELAEIGQLIDGGAIGFSDGKHPIANAEIMRRALQYAGMWNKPILHHAQVPELVQGGTMHEGFQSTILGLRGMPAAAEEIMVRRDIALAETTGGRVHLMAISSLRSVEEVRRAILRGLRVSASVTPHHLLLTDEALEGYGTHCKVDPPLRTEEHRQALIEGLKDGTIGVIASDHQPFAEEKKTTELDHAPFGIAGLETLLPICVAALIQPGHLTWPQLLSKLTLGPAQLFGLDSGTMRPGAPADITVIDPEARWRINAAEFHSRSRNSPFHQTNVQGRVRYTIVGGEVRYTAPDAPPHKKS